MPILNLIKIELQLLSSVNDYFWFQLGMKDRIWLLGKRLVRVNHPEIPEKCNKKIPNNCIFALDATNHY